MSDPKEKGHVASVARDGGLTAATIPASAQSSSSEITRQLASLEHTIKSGLDTFQEVGDALLKIRDGKLYRESHETFEAYCGVRWNMSARHCNRLIGAAVVAENLGPIGPVTESQARPLLSLPQEEQKPAWDEAKASAEADGKPVTGRHVQQAVDARRPKRKPPTIDVASKIVPLCGVALPDDPAEQKREPGERAFGLVFAEMAIQNLKKIARRDPDRRAAFQKVGIWIQQNFDGGGK